MRAWGKLLVLAVAALIVTQILVRQARPAFAVGEKAPPLALPDLASRRVDLDAYRGRVVAVNFWASWCGPCREEILALSEAWLARRQRCFEVLGVAEESGSRDDVAEAAGKLGIPYPVLLDADGSAAAAYRVPGYPRTYLVDPEGKVQRVFTGALSRRALEEAVAPLLPTSCPRA
jgi:cytochrome c biogenesis protein CcmG, thiol:disulfide interchange protein DsbE